MMTEFADIAEVRDSPSIHKPPSCLYAFAYVPIAFSTGATLDPLIGGSLSRPADQFPWLFGSNPFLKKYPYFLPCAISATFTVLSLILALVYLKETVKSPIPLSHFIAKRKPTLHTEDSPTAAIENNEAPLPIRAVMTPKVLVAAGNYAMLSLIDIAYQIHNRWGSRNTFCLGFLAAILVFTLFPVMNWVARKEGVCGVLPTMSVICAIGPTTANSLYSLSIEKGYLGGNLVYLVLIGVVGMTYWIALLLLPGDGSIRRSWHKD
ncbi:hypothetical protein M378DRAFT_172815 [Amanita muscaria Koide BX008]|uniref:Uncharacterized protein n=1 Tax=Amanita muscaria (strain Koide BX008) TaxID=946122 RepID=A0A0C2S134_AMAMK|nr:hypothetical protein M378DRAFT_172815 [Amanita muscaria Koide BX008]